MRDSDGTKHISNPGSNRLHGSVTGRQQVPYESNNRGESKPPVCYQI